MPGPFIPVPDPQVIAKSVMDWWDRMTQPSTPATPPKPAPPKNKPVVIDPKTGQPRTPQVGPTQQEVGQSMIDMAGRDPSKLLDSHRIYLEALGAEIPGIPATSGGGGGGGGGGNKGGGGGGGGGGARAHTASNVGGQNSRAVPAGPTPEEIARKKAQGEAMIGTSARDLLDRYRFTQRGIDHNVDWAGTNVPAHAAHERYTPAFWNDLKSWDERLGYMMDDPDFNDPRNMSPTFAWEKAYGTNDDVTVSGYDPQGKPSWGAAVMGAMPESWMAEIQHWDPALQQAALKAYQEGDEATFQHARNTARGGYRTHATGYANPNVPQAQPGSGGTSAAQGSSQTSQNYMQGKQSLYNGTPGRTPGQSTAIGYGDWNPLGEPLANQLNRLGRQKGGAWDIPQGVGGYGGPPQAGNPMTTQPPNVPDQLPGSYTQPPHTGPQVGIPTPVGNKPGDPNQPPPGRSVGMPVPTFPGGGPGAWNNQMTTQPPSGYVPIAGGGVNAYANGGNGLVTMNGQWPQLSQNPGRPYFGPPPMTLQNGMEIDINNLTPENIQRLLQLAQQQTNNRY